MWQVRSVTRPRRYRSWLAALVVVPAVVLGLSACDGSPAPQQPKTIADKGTPFDDLLVPKLADVGHRRRRRRGRWTSRSRSPPRTACSVRSR